MAVEIGLDKLVQVTKYVNANTNNNIYGNALEALMGAIYLDFGYKKCKAFVQNKLIKSKLDLDKIADDEVNFKSKLIEWCQKYHLQCDFLLIDDVLEGANKHNFQTRLTIQGIEICEGSGPSKKESQQNASRIAFDLINEKPDFLHQILSKVSQSDEIDSTFIQ